MKAKAFDKKFDDGEDIVEHLDLKSARRINQGQKDFDAELKAVDELSKKPEPSPNEESSLQHRKKS